MYCKEIRKKGIVLSLTQENPWQGEIHSIDFLYTSVCVCVREFVRVLHVCVHGAIRACLCRQYVNVHYRSNDS